MDGHVTLVLGMPRAGTTWFSTALAVGTGADYVHEPDNEKLRLCALAAKSKIGRFPILSRGDTASAYGSLWVEAACREQSRPAKLVDYAYRRLVNAETAITGDSSRNIDRISQAWCRAEKQLSRRHRSSEAVVVKTVHAALSADFVVDVLTPDAVIVLHRSPLNTIASWIDLAMPDADRALDQNSNVLERVIGPHGLPRPSPTFSMVERMAWQYGLLDFGLKRFLMSRPEACIAISHDELVACDPSTAFADIAGGLGHDWLPAGDEFLNVGRAAGDGYRTSRSPSQLVDRWRRTLSPEDALSVARVLEPFGFEQP